MSKEKNLTTKTRTGHVITIKDSAYGYSTGMPRVTEGPAIDRLYEFEKLGMEPEEIDYVLSSKVSVEEYCTRINEKNEEIQELKDELAIFRQCVNNDKLVIENLEKENQNFKDEIASLTEQVHVIQCRKENQAATIRGLMEENEELRAKVDSSNICRRHRELYNENKQLNIFYELYKSMTEELLIVCESLTNELKALKEAKNE